MRAFLRPLKRTRRRLRRQRLAGCALISAHLAEEAPCFNRPLQRNFERLRLVPQKTLDVVDADLLQSIGNGLSFHALGDGLDPDDLGDVGKAANGCRIQRVVQQVPDELTINLDDVDRDGLQIAEGCSAGAKIIQVAEATGNFDAFTVIPTVTITHTGSGKKTVWNVQVAAVGSQNSSALAKIAGRKSLDVSISATSQSARGRGLRQESDLETLFQDPTAHITPLQGSELWQVALLELWLQTNDI